MAFHSRFVVQTTFWGGQIEFQKKLCCYLYLASKDRLSWKAPLHEKVRDTELVSKIAQWWIQLSRVPLVLLFLTAFYFLLLFSDLQGQFKILTKFRWDTEPVSKIAQWWAELRSLLLQASSTVQNQKPVRCDEKTRTMVKTAKPRWVHAEGNEDRGFGGVYNCTVANWSEKLSMQQLGLPTESQISSCSLARTCVLANWDLLMWRQQDF